MLFYEGEEPGETWEECERKVHCLLSEELNTNNVVIECTHRIKVYSHEKKNKKLRSRTIVCKLLSFVDKARNLKNSHRLKGTTYYVNKDFSKETVAYKERIMRKGKSFEERRLSCLFKLYKSIVDKEKNDPKV